MICHREAFWDAAYTGHRAGDVGSGKEKNENAEASVIERVCSEDEEG